MLRSVLFCPGLLVLACGGTTGTSNHVGGGTGARQDGGARDSGVMGTGGCCAAIPNCRFGDTVVTSLTECPDGASCYEVEMCCARVACLERAVPCGPAPACAPHDRQISACPEPEPQTVTGPYSCYTEEACDTVVTCARALPAITPSPVDGGTCPDSAAHWKRYVGTAAQCAEFSLHCSAFTSEFRDACGCGCEQDPACPEVIDCSPEQGEPSPVCANAGAFKCPFSTFVPKR